MKKLWIVVLVLLMGFTFAMAQEIHWADQATGEWDEVTLYDDGEIIPAEYKPLSYRAWLAEWDGSARIAGTENMVGETGELFYTYTLADGIHDPGVQAVIYYGSYAATSTIEWGSEQVNPFLFGRARNPAAPGSFRPQ